MGGGFNPFGQKKICKIFKVLGCQKNANFCTPLECTSSNKKKEGCQQNAHHREDVGRQLYAWHTHSPSFRLRLVNIALPLEIRCDSKLLVFKKKKLCPLTQAKGGRNKLGLENFFLQFLIFFCPARKPGRGSQSLCGRQTPRKAPTWKKKVNCI